MGNGSRRRFGKFYESQVDKILGILDIQFKPGQISSDTYLDICEQKGIAPDPNEMPPTLGSYPYEVQVAFLLHDLLPDRWDGMSGSYFGKDMAALGTLLDVHDVDDKRNTIFWIKQIEAKNSEAINKKIDRKRKASQNKAKGPGINSANLKR